MTADNLPDIGVPDGSATGDQNDTFLGKKPVLALEFEQLNGAIVLHCHGRVVFRSDVRVLSTLIAEVLPSARRMVVDLAGVDSIDIAGLGELVLTQMWADASGYILKLAGAKNSVHRLFESTNLVSVFDVHGTVPEAIAAMCPPEEQLA